MGKTIYKIISAVLIISHIFTICLRDMAYAQKSATITKDELIGNDQKGNSGAPVVQRYSLGSETSNPTPAPEKVIKSFYLDPFSGSAVISLPFAVPPGINGVQPNLALSYSPGNENGVFGFGWSMNLGSIERSTKNGVPKYDSTDTFIYSLNGSNSELVSIGIDEYRAKIEGAFLKFKFKGTSWEVKDKQGNTYIFGLNDTSKIINSQGIFKWCLEKITDINGNYMVISYSKEQNQIYPSQIQYTGNEITQASPNFTVDFVLEDRTDYASNYRIGSDIRILKRVKEIIANVKDKLLKKYVLEYKYSSKTNRSFLNKVTEYNSDETSASPPLILNYQNIVESTYNVSSITGDPTQGDNLWNVKFGGLNYYDGSITWSPVFTQNSGSWSYSSSGWDTNLIGRHFVIWTIRPEWKTQANGSLNIFKAPIFDVWTYVYVKAAKTISLPIVNNVRQINYYLNGKDIGSSIFNLDAGYNLIEILGQGILDSTPVSFDLNYSYSVDLMNSTQVVLPQLSSDFNGDGKTDAGTFFASSGEVKVALSNGECFLPKQSWIENFAVNQKVILGDFNGDGKTDICGFDTAAGNWRAALSDGSKFVDNGIWLANFGNGQDSNQAQTGDFNGDSKTDICVFYIESGSLRCYIALSNGAGFEAPLAYKPNIGSDKDSAFLGDFNGDGLIDIACFNYDTGDWKFKINDGAFKDFKELETVSGSGAKKNIVVSDFNSDGLTDIGYYDCQAGKIITKVSNGRGFEDSRELALQFSLKDSSVQIQTADYNGDGLTDFSAYNALGNLELALSQGQFTDILSKVDNGIGGGLDLKYNPSSKYDNTGGDGAVDLPFVIPVVSESIISDGQGNSYSTTYSYSGGLYDVQDRDFRGFACASTIDSQGTTSQSWFKQDAIFKGRPYKQEIKDKDGKLYSRNENTWEEKQLYPGVHLPYISQTDNYVFDDTNSLHKRIKFEYNDEGNPTKVLSEGDTQITGDEKTQKTEYTNSTADGILSLPKYTYLEDSQGKKVSQKWFYYDNHNSIDVIPEKGRLTKEEAWLYNPITQTDQRINSQFAYNDYGSLVSTTNALGRKTTTVYDTEYHTYPIEITNAIGQTIKTVYYGINEPETDEIKGSGIFGQEKYTLDLNNQKTYKIYDSLGRISKVIGPYDNQDNPAVTYAYDLGTRPIKVSKIVKSDYSSQPKYLTAYQFYDGLGRLIQSKSPAEDDPQTKQKRQIISDIVQLDIRGQVKEKYFPYFVNESSEYVMPTYETPHVTFNYDALGRMVESVNPDATFSKAEYYCDKAISIDENGHSKTSYTDAYDRIVKVEEHNQNQTYTTIYEYDVLGNLTKITDNQQNITKISYDSLGRKIQMADTDMGIWAYEYDKAGSLTKQTDAKGQELGFEYDAVNRLVKKVSFRRGAEGNEACLPDRQAILVNYIYDDTTKPNCIGRLSKIKDQSGGTEFFYDELGRETKSIKTVNASSPAFFTVQKKYDALDRLTQLTYPDGEIVLYEYNPQGIEKVEGRGTKDEGRLTKEYIKNIDYSPTNQLKRVDYGNGTSTEYNYEPNTLRLEHLITQSPHGKIQDLNYQFDNTGNVKNIIDHCNTATQSFIYDDLSRLTQASGNYGVYNYDYDSIGNMLNKEGMILNYGKDGKLPHAVTQYGDTKINYDANGNMVSKTKVSRADPDETMAYDAENRLTKVENKTNVSAAAITLTLSPGWNFISFPFILQDSKIEKTLEPIKGKYEQVSRYNPVSALYEHYVGNSKYCQFDKFEYGRGYQIYITAKENVVLTVTGRTPDTNQSLLIRGSRQNLIFCPAANEISVQDGLKPLKMGLHYNKVFHYNKAKKKYEEYSYLKKEFTTLKPAEAYFIYGLLTNTWKIPNTSAVNTTTFIYDGDGGRVRKTTDDGRGTINSTTYIGSLFEISQDNSTKYIFAGANRICSVEGTVAAGFSLRYYHTDHIGSSNVITDANGNQTGFTEFTPYGTTYKQTGTTDPKYKFTGKELDNSTGLYYYGARYYDPEIGRFAQADTIVQAPYDPQSLNRYSYCRNNPINYTDPTGHKWSWKKFWHAAVGALVGVALACILGPAGIGMSMAMAGMIGGAAGGAITGGLDGGWKGALIGGAMGGLLGGIGGWAVGGGHTGILAGMFVAGVGVTGATNSWDSFTGGLIGAVAGGGDR